MESKFRANLANRVKRAKALSDVKIVTESVIALTGSEDPYAIRVIRTGKTMRISCKNVHSNEACKGNQFGTVCYHGIRTAWELAQSKGYKVAFCALEEHAIRLSNLGGNVYEIRSEQGSRGSLWMVANKIANDREADWRQAQLSIIENAIADQELIVTEKPWSIIAKKNLKALQVTRDILQAQLG